MAHYLDDFMAAFPASTSEIELQYAREQFNEMAGALGIPDKEKKRLEGKVLEMLGLLINTSDMTVSIPSEKLSRIVRLTAQYKKSREMTLKQAESLGGLLSFCAVAVQLGWVFCQRIWTFIAELKASKHLWGARRFGLGVAEDLE